MFKQKYLASAFLLTAFFNFTTPMWAADVLAYQPTPLAKFADSSSPQAVQARKTRPPIALAPGGGDVRSAANIGVLKFLARENLPVDFKAAWEPLSAACMRQECH